MKAKTPFNTPLEQYRGNQDGLPDWLFRLETAIRKNRSNMIHMRKTSAQRLCTLSRCAFNLFTALDRNNYKEARVQLELFRKALDEAEITAKQLLIVNSQKEGLPKEP
jgi:hypothetical protein